MSLSDRAGARRRSSHRDELPGLDERTLALLDEHGPKAMIRHRGWLVRRMLLASDVAGLSVAFLLTELFLGAQAAYGLRAGAETLVFLAALPGWVVAAKLSGLYDHDEERADHSTVDELAG